MKQKDKQPKIAIPFFLNLFVTSLDSLLLAACKILKAKLSIPYMMSNKRVSQIGTQIIATVNNRISPRGRSRSLLDELMSTGIAPL